MYELIISTRYIRGVKRSFTIVADNIGAVLQCLYQLMTEQNIEPPQMCRGKLYFEAELQGTIAYKKTKGWVYNPCIQKKLSVVLERLTILERR